MSEGKEGLISLREIVEKQKQEDRKKKEENERQEQRKKENFDEANKIEELNNKELFLIENIQKNQISCQKKTEENKELNGDKEFLREMLSNLKKGYKNATQSKESFKEIGQNLVDIFNEDQEFFIGIGINNKTELVKYYERNFPGTEEIVKYRNNGQKLRNEVKNLILHREKIQKKYSDLTLNFSASHREESIKKIDSKVNEIELKYLNVQKEINQLEKEITEDEKKIDEVRLEKIKVGINSKDSDRFHEAQRKIQQRIFERHKDDIVNDSGDFIKTSDLTGDIADADYLDNVRAERIIKEEFFKSCVENTAEFKAKKADFEKAPEYWEKLKKISSQFEKIGIIRGKVKIGDQYIDEKIYDNLIKMILHGYYYPEENERKQNEFERMRSKIFEMKHAIEENDKKFFQRRGDFIPDLDVAEKYCIFYQEFFNKFTDYLAQKTNFLDSQDGLKSYRGIAGWTYDELSEKGSLNLEQLSKKIGMDMENENTTDLIKKIGQERDQEGRDMVFDYYRLPFYSKEDVVNVNNLGYIEHGYRMLVNDTIHTIEKKYLDGFQNRWNKAKYEYFIKKHSEINGIILKDVQYKKDKEISEKLYSEICSLYKGLDKRFDEDLLDIKLSHHRLEVKDEIFLRDRSESSSKFNEEKKHFCEVFDISESYFDNFDMQEKLKKLKLRKTDLQDKLKEIFNFYKSNNREEIKKIDEKAQLINQMRDHQKEQEIMHKLTNSYFKMINKLEDAWQKVNKQVNEEDIKEIQKIKTLRGLIDLVQNEVYNMRFRRLTEEEKKLLSKYQSLKQAAQG